MRTDDSATAEFHRFFEQHHRELARLAYLLTGDADAADDLAADALLAAWRRWDRVRSSDHPIAYVRRIVINLAGSRVRRLVRERAKLTMANVMPQEWTEAPDVPGMIDLRAALQRLPARKRACVVLRHAFDLSEQETARVLGISVGTVKSQTSKGVTVLERLLRAGQDGITADALLRPSGRDPRGRQPFTASTSTYSRNGSAPATSTASSERHGREA